jgi:hypothetical protein
VHDAVSGAALAGVRVSSQSRSPEALGSHFAGLSMPVAWTTADGRFELEGLAPGKRWVFAFLHNYAMENDNLKVNIAPEGVEPIAVGLFRGGPVAGRLERPAEDSGRGQRLDLRVRLRALPGGGGRDVSARLEEDGSFRAGAGEAARSLSPRARLLRAARPAPGSRRSRRG